MPRPDAAAAARVEVTLPDGTVRRGTVRRGEILLVGVGGPLPGRLPIAVLCGLDLGQGTCSRQTRRKGAPNDDA